ncbi:DivIVA domain-containing protein [Phorcysia thermohydrogeniphila]|uniref:Cell division initiation protein n=1 Tax=Phorcysia thermohydrogeniphila TaxID=936138 RepID=A0A4R1GCY7_9BACT|nr:DivIVA domain-containing protein [Phorcysia thermohydrogeniphila]TCK04693.1 cell division initiation protein [Phorcysia thermohydrogeniphila]
MKNVQGRKVKLRPQDIRTKEFSKKLFGYDPDEVEAFLIEVANAYQELLKEIESLRVKTPEYKTEKLVEKAKKEIEKIVQKKLEEKKELEKQKKELELEIEKLKLAQKQFFDRLKMTILDMTRILEELRPNATGKKEERGSGTGSEGSTQGLSEQDRGGGRGEAENQGNSSS